MRLVRIDDTTNTVDLGQIEILFYHGRPVAFKDFDAKTLYAMTETVSEDTSFRRDFKKAWSGEFEVTGGQAELENKIREALRQGG
ncbi:MAG: hypothetical protein R3223_01790 [Longimicrobiales bacterium]|nr:hypothetical protein [Longimicrobiales bacterium]